jgi:uncharacterized protein (TIGR03435 family)
MNRHREWAAFMLCCLSAAAAYSQTAKLTFEVASVRPSGPFVPRTPEDRTTGGPGTNDPERIIYSRVSMQRLIMAAYGVGPDQISGPEWANADTRTAVRFDISAKVPPGTTKTQAAEMLQNLLAERFQLALHHVTRDFSGYALVVSKGGSKLKTSTGDPTASDRATVAADGAISMELAKDGFPLLFPGRNMGGSFKDGVVRERFRDYPISDLVQQLSNGLRLRVTDRTGLAGKYDFTLQFEAPGLLPMGFILALAPGQAATISSAPPDPSLVDGVPIVSSAMEKQLGLKLEAAKIPLDTLVIDHVEKTPSEN